MVQLFLNNKLLRLERAAPYEWGEANSGNADSDLLNLAVGNYNLRTVATDNVGNTKEATISFTVENNTNNNTALFIPDPDKLLYRQCWQSVQTCCRWRKRIFITGSQ